MNDKDANSIPIIMAYSLIKIFGKPRLLMIFKIMPQSTCLKERKNCPTF